MNGPDPGPPARLRLVADGLRSFWPLFLTPFALGFPIGFHQPWIGILLFAGMALAVKRWWTCTFGLLNAMAVFGGFVACATAALKILIR